MSAGAPLKAVVRYAYVAEDANQLSLEVGELVTIHSCDSEDWWDGETTDERRGYLPAKYVELLQYTIPAYQPGVGVGDEMELGALKKGLRDQAGQLMQVPLGTNINDSASLYMSSPTTSGISSEPLLAADSQLGSTFWTTSSSSSSSAATDATIGLSSSQSSFFGGGGGSGLVSPRGSTFSLWSSSLGRTSGWVALVSGAFTLGMGLWDTDYFKQTYIFVGVWSLILGGLTIGYESVFGMSNRAAYRIPIRALAYGLALVPLLVVYPTRVAAVLYALVALINLVSAARGESVVTKPRRLEHPAEDDVGVLLAPDGQSASGGRPKHRDETHENGMFVTYFLDRRFAHRGRRWLLLLALLAFELAAGGILTWWQMRDGNGDWNVWYQTGRTLVWLVLLNLLLFFATAMRHTARLSFDAAERSRVLATRTVSNAAAATLLTFFPPDPHHALLFYHKVLAGFILLFSIAHALAHTLSFMVQPQKVLGRYTAWVWTSGGILIVILFVIYSVSRREIRLASPKLFRWVHALYAPFFLLLVLHAPQGFSTSALLVLLLPMAAWLADLAYNYITRRRRGVPLLSVSFLRPNTIRLEAGTHLSESLRGQFKEGDYALISFPPLGSQFIPVGISSAPQAGPHSLLGGTRGGHGELEPLREARDDRHGTEGSAIVLHLKVDTTSLTSSTARWLEYFQSLGPLGASHFLLDEPGHRRATSSGRVWDPQGQRLLRIDGPHASPVAHLTKYHTCLLVAPSSGVAGLCSAMRSVLQHRWRSHVTVAGGLGDSRLKLGSPGAMLTTPDVLFLFWTLKWDEIDDHRWVIQAIKDCEDDLFALREAAAGGPSDAFLRGKHFELHCHVTGAPPVDGQVGGHGLSAAVNDADFFGPTTSVTGASGGARAPFTSVQLYRALKNPSMGVQRFSSVHVHRGAPNWGDLTSSVSHRAAGQAAIGCILSCGPLAAHLTHAGARALKEQGAIDVPSPADIDHHRILSQQLKAICAHHSAQSGKTWAYHTDVDIQ